MRVYQLRHYEVMMPEENSKEAQHLLYYERLCYDLLTAHAISFSHAVEVMKMQNGRIERRPGRIHRILSAAEIPPFCFIVCKN